MDKIRNTMMQHEALFKEQVQALHKLYNIQKSAMQETKNRIYSQPKAPEFDSESVMPTDDQLHGSVLDWKPSRPAYASGLAYEDDPLVLSLRPLYMFKETKSSCSLWMDGKGVRPLTIVQSNLMRNFDLEKLPEEHMDESEVVAGLNSSEVPDANSIVSVRAPITDEISSVGANLGAIQVNSQCLKQTFSETDLGMLLVPSQETSLASDKASEGKMSETDEKKSIIASSGSSKISERVSSEIFSEYFHAAGSRDVQLDSSHTDNSCKEELVSYQGSSSIFASQSNPPEKILEQDRGIIDRACAKPQRDHGRDGPNMTTHHKLEEQINCYVGGNSFGINPAVQHEPKAPDNFSILTKIDPNNNHLQNSGNGCSNIQPQDQDQMISKLENSHVNAEDIPELAIKTGSCEPVIARGSMETAQHKLDLDLHEACENVAAKILLSLSPGKSGKSGRDAANVVENKWNLRERRHTSYTGDGGINESIKWAKSVSRRTSRRHR